MPDQATLGQLAELVGGRLRGNPATPVEETASWGYLRLRRQDYDKAALRRWAKRLRAQSYGTAYVFFKHEAEGAGPALADSFGSMMI